MIIDRLDKYEQCYFVHLLPLVVCREVITVYTPNRYTGALDLQKCGRRTLFEKIKRHHCLRFFFRYIC